MGALNHNAWVVGEKDIYNIKEFVEQQGVPLQKWEISINYGIKTGYNEAFIISGAVKDRLILEDPKSKDLIKPILRGKDISAWHPDFEDLWLIATFPSLNLNISDYKAIENYLTSFLPQLKQTGEEFTNSEGKIQKTRKKTFNKWFETQDQISYWRDFEKPKIIYRDITQTFDFCYVEKEMYTNNTVYIITGTKLKYLTCIFNSKLFNYCFKNNFTDLGGEARRLFSVFFEKIPIKHITETEEIPFAKMLDYLVALKKLNSKESTDQFMFLFFEQIANALVFEFYFKSIFEQHNLHFAKYIKQLPNLEIDEPLLQLRKIFVLINNQYPSIKQDLFSVLSIPQIAIVMNNNL